jgi:hypothetical protein
MKKLFLILFFLLITLPPRSAEAHVLQTDHSIGAVLHISPDDDPKAGEQSGFFFEFKDKENKFKPENCNCTFTILSQGKELFSQPLFQDNSDPNLSNASLFYTFSNPDIYQIRVTGKPSTPGAFNEFTLIYDVRVEVKDGKNYQNSSKPNWFTEHLPHIFGVGIGIIVLAGVIIKQKKK